MADPKDPKQRTAGGTFLGAAAMAGVVGGTYTAYKSGIFHQSPPTNSFIAASQAARRGYRSYSKEEHLKFVEQYMDFMKTPEGAELARQAWKESVETVNPTNKAILDFMGDVGTVPSGDVYSAIRQTIQRNESAYIGRTSSMFRRTLKAYKRHFAVTKSLPSFKQAPPLSQIVRASNISIEDMLPNIGSRVSSIANKLNANATVQFYSRPGWMERGLGNYLVSFNTKKGNWKINIPLTSNGVLSEGLTQSSLRIAPDVMLFDPVTGGITHQMNRTEFFLHDIENAIVPAVLNGQLEDSYAIKDAISQLYEKDIYAMESIPNLPSNISNEAWSNYQRIKGQFTDIRFFDPTSRNLTNTFRSPTSKELMNVMKAHPNLYPLPSPSNLAEGRLSTYDPRGWVMTPEAMDFSRNPRQVLREWKAAPDAAREIMKSRWSIFETQQWRQDLGHHTAPWFKTVWVNPDAHADLLENWSMGEGESLLANTPDVRRKTRAFRSAFPANLREIEKGVEDRIRTGAMFQEGEVLGRTVEGDPFVYKSGMKLRSVNAFNTVGKDSFFQLAYDEERDMAQSESKYGASKGMERMVDPWTIQKDIARIAKNDQFTSNVQRWITMDELKKDRSKHNTQMITALWEVMDRRMQVLPQSSVGSWGNRVLRDPTGTAKFLSKQSVINDAYSHEAFVKRMLKIASAENLDPEEFGSVFGALPYTMDPKWVKSAYDEFKVSSEARLAASRGFAGGVSQNVYAGPKTGFAGGLGSLEPRAFEVLQAGHYGELGNEMASDLASRLAASNPEKLSTYDALTKSLRSILGEVKPGEGERVWDLSKMSQRYTNAGFQASIEQGGFWLRTGKHGIGDIYVPGAEEASGMASFKAASGEVFSGDVAKMYHAYARKASMLHADVGTISEEEVRTSLSDLLAGIHKQQAPIGKGAGAVLGGPVSGSRFLVGVSSAGGYTPRDIFTVGISESYANEMFDEMLEMGLDDPEEVAKMKERFMKGNKIGGVVARHPFIEQYSLQPINFQVIPNETQPVMALPTTNVSLGIRDATGELISKDLKLSPLIGAGGDLDRDTFAAFMVSPKLGKKISNYLDTPGIEASFQDMIRMQLIKAKAVGEGGGPTISIMDKMIADATKLGTAQSWVPILSTELSAAKFAVGKNLQGRQAADARFLLYFLEQVPISGKHLKAEDVLQNKMQGFFKTVQESLSSKDAGALASSVEGILKSNDIAKQLLTRDLKIESGMEDIRRITGQELSDTIPGINLKQTATNIMESIASAEDSGAMRTYREMAGRQSIRPSSLRNYLRATSEVLTEKVSQSGTMAKVISTTMETMNHAASAGKRLIKNPKVGLGFAGALAVGMALSSPKETIGPSAALDTPPADLNAGKAANRMSPDQMAPSQPMGNPQAPNRISPQRSMIAPGRESARMSVRAHSGKRVNRAALSGALSGASGSTVNINIRDNSQRINPHVLANKIL